MKILGIDAGMKGALAYYDGEELLIWDMPIFAKEKGNDLDIHKLQVIFKEADVEHVFLEKTVAMPKVSGKAAYSMGKSEGALLMACAANNLPYTLIRPREWKQVMGCAADKDVARQRASQLLPAYAHNWDRKKDDGRAEASLIALMGYNLLNVKNI
jgi:Holliday junction resolvasome RuvABC endonuclease subunit